LTRLFPFLSFIANSSKPVSYLELDINTSKMPPASPREINAQFPGFILIYEEGDNSNSSIRFGLKKWFDTILNQDTSNQNRIIFKKCLPFKHKFDQLLIEAFKKQNGLYSVDTQQGLHFLSFWYDLEHQTCYLYSIGMFDFFLFNGKVAGSPIAPIQNRANMITNQDFTKLESSVPEKSFHMVFENGLTSDGSFLYCGLPLPKTHQIHSTPLLSKIFYRLKRDASVQCKQEMEERINKTLPKQSHSEALDAFYYIMALIPD